MRERALSRSLAVLSFALFLRLSAPRPLSFGSTAAVVAGIVHAPPTLSEGGSHSDSGRRYVLLHQCGNANGKFMREGKRKEEEISGCEGHSQEPRLLFL